ncbi:MAG: SDR family NAD(P)-dependent oxidoreductase, partial [Thiotrichaceae bacterium]|nr:SDR family NAD(P)-dependent oxidoreductase [Thiotrichaceae bacterium]
MKILVTGGAGYIGSHTCIELLNNDYEVVVVDNLCNSSKESLKRVKKITGKELLFYQDDVLDESALVKIFTEQNIDAVIHFAGLKAVGESVEKPLEYYQTNLTGTLVLFKVMRDFNVKNFVFSSSATVYGDPHT